MAGLILAGTRAADEMPATKRKRPKQTIARSVWSAPYSGAMSVGNEAEAEEEAEKESKSAGIWCIPNASRGSNALTRSQTTGKFFGKIIDSLFRHKTKREHRFARAPKISRNPNPAFTPPIGGAGYVHFDFFAFHRRDLNIPRQSHDPAIGCCPTQTAFSHFRAEIVNENGYLLHLSFWQNVG